MVALAPLAFSVLAFFVAAMGLLAWLGVRVRRRPRGASDAVMGPWEELWHPAAHRARLRTETIEERVTSYGNGQDGPNPLRISE